MHVGNYCVEMIGKEVNRNVVVNSRSYNIRHLILFGVVGSDNNYWSSGLGRGTDRQKNIQVLQVKIISSSFVYVRSVNVGKCSGRDPTTMSFFSLS